MATPLTNRYDFMLVFDVGRDGSHADTHRPDEDKGVELLPICRDGIATYGNGCWVLLLETEGNGCSCLADLYDGYLHFFLALKASNCLKQWRFIISSSWRSGLWRMRQL